jgi:hypothetical protein
MTRTFVYTLFLDDIDSQTLGTVLGPLDDVANKYFCYTSPTEILVRNRTVDTNGVQVASAWVPPRVSWIL